MTTDQQIAQAIWATIYFGIALALYAYLSHRAEDGMPPRWRLWLAAFQGRYVITSPSEIEEDAEESVVAPPATIATSTANSVATPNNASNEALLQQRAATLAKLVKAGKVGETEGILIVFGERASSTNPRYQQARAMLKEELARLAPPPSGPQFPPLTDEQRELRELLGLENRG